METPLKEVLSLGRGLVLAAMVTGCVATARPVSAPDDGVRTLLVEEIRRKLANSTLPAAWDSSRVEITVSASGVVPGLRYHRGTYTVPGLSHGFAFAVAGAREDHRLILRTASDWAVLASGWSPSDPAEALRACSELVSVAGADPDPRSLPVVVDSLSLQSRRLPHSIRGLPREAYPRVQFQGERANVLIWALEPGIRRRYSCSLAWASAQLQAQLIVTDSVPGEGLRPLGP